jgi:hypothetical protein
MGRINIQTFTAVYYGATGNKRSGVVERAEIVD